MSQILRRNIGIFTKLPSAKGDRRRCPITEEQQKLLKRDVEHRRGPPIKITEQNCIPEARSLTSACDLQLNKAKTNLTSSPMVTAVYR